MGGGLTAFVCLCVCVCERESGSLEGLVECGWMWGCLRGRQSGIQRQLLLLLGSERAFKSSPYIPQLPSSIRLRLNAFSSRKSLREEDTLPSGGRWNQVDVSVTTACVLLCSSQGFLCNFATEWPNLRVIEEHEAVSQVTRPLMMAALWQPHKDVICLLSLFQFPFSCYSRNKTHKQMCLKLKWKKEIFIHVIRKT